MESKLVDSAKQSIYDALRGRCRRQQMPAATRSYFSVLSACDGSLRRYATLMHNGSLAVTAHFDQRLLIRESCRHFIAATSRPGTSIRLPSSRATVAGTGYSPWGVPEILPANTNEMP